MSRDFAPLLNETKHWWQDCGEIARLLRWLHIDSEEHSPIEVEEAIDVVEKPWHWDAEYSVMCREQEGSGVARENEKLAKSEEP